PTSLYDAGYVNNGMMTMPAMAMILLGCVIWAQRALTKDEQK
ncbi:MAG: NADH:ubiquinone reductase (Na(+)-transporting) subunit D, partial [Alloprevotella sp.]|nr:NADH:ubiquinone reductase (Na(+)-transporting) subunit D [Prevotellamassilia sp.]MDY5761745.1 NADH:ubiquinone reductase (Na(+)-transporting) subunit D [Alloprevotella sp.]